MNNILQVLDGLAECSAEVHVHRGIEWLHKGLLVHTPEPSGSYRVNGVVGTLRFHLNEVVSLYITEERTHIVLSTYGEEVTDAW